MEPERLWLRYLDKTKERMPQSVADWEYRTLSAEKRTPEAGVYHAGVEVVDVTTDPGCTQVLTEIKTSKTRNPLTRAAPRADGPRRKRKTKKPAHTEYDILRVRYDFSRQEETADRPSRQEGLALHVHPKIDTQSKPEEPQRQAPERGQPSKPQLAEVSSRLPTPLETLEALKKGERVPIQESARFLQSPLEIQQEIFIRAGRVHVLGRMGKALLPADPLERHFFAWAELACESMAPPEVPEIPDEEIGGRIHSEPFRSRWLRIARESGDIWLLNIMKYGYDAWGHRKNAKPMRYQHWTEIPVGLRSEEDLKWGKPTIEKLCKIGAMVALDPECANWEQIRHSKRLIQQHVDRNRKADETENPWRQIVQAMLVEKPGEDPRMVANFQPMNCFYEWVKEAYHSQSEQEFKTFLAKNEYLISLDLKKYYHQIKASWRTAQSQIIVVRGVRYMFLTAAMGPTLVPFIAERLAYRLSWLCQKEHHAAATRFRIDDHYGGADTYKNAIAVAKTIVKVYTHLGLVIHSSWKRNEAKRTGKSELRPSAVRVVLKEVYNLRTKKQYTPAARRKKLKSLCRRILQLIDRQEAVSPLELARTKGIAVSCRPGSSATFMYTQGLQHLLTRMVRFAGWDGYATIDPDYFFHAVRDLISLQNIDAWTGSMMYQEIPSVFIAADGSPFARGANFLSSDLSEVVSVESRLPTTAASQALFTQEEIWRLSHNEKELETSIWALVVFVLQFNLYRVTICLFTDSCVVRRYLRAGGKFAHLAFKAARILQWLLEFRGIRVVCEWVPGTSMDGCSDDWSRYLKQMGQWILHRDIFDRIVQPRAGKRGHGFDMFAAFRATQCRRYASMYPDGVAEVIDTFSIHHDWKRILRNAIPYACPPWALTEKTLDLIRKHQLPQVTMVMRNPLGQTYLTQMFEMMFQPIEVIPASPWVFAPASTANLNEGVRSCPRWTPILVGVSGISSRCAAFRKRLLTQSQNHGTISKPGAGVASVVSTRGIRGPWPCGFPTPTALARATHTCEHLRQRWKSWHGSIV